MLDLTRIPDGVLSALTPVVHAIVQTGDGLHPDQIMVVGAYCRDILHSAQGHTFLNTATDDLDLALALSSWQAYESLAAAFPRIGDAGIRYRIAGCAVDLLPFSGIEDPRGVARPRSRGESLSVWAFEEIFANAVPLPLADGLIIRLPTIAGYAAAKMGAWLDRSADHEVKDAPDLALCLHWYFMSSEVDGRLYETSGGNEIFLAEDADLQLAAARLLGRDLAETIGAERLSELLERWPGDESVLIRELAVRGAPHWTTDAERRRSFVGALTRGLSKHIPWL